jgi:hypothetical protein
MGKPSRIKRPGELIDFDHAKRRLVGIWLACAGLMVLVLVLASVLGKFRIDGTDRAMQVWQWFLPTFMPTLSVMVAVFVLDARKAAGRVWLVRRFFYRMTRNLSLFYFLIVFIVYASAALPEVPELRAFEVSNWFLPPLQGLVSASLGIFFLERE